MPYTEIPNGKIYYADHRTTNTPYIPVLFIHGAGGTHLDWSAELRRLPQANTFALDLPGHGKSDGDGRESIQGYAQDIIAFLNALDLQQVIVAGHSMGGAIAQTLALTYPERIKAIILAGTGAKLRVHPNILERLLVDQSEVGELLKQWMWSSTTSAALREASYQQFMEIPAETTYHDYYACNNFDIRAQLDEIKQSALVIGGTEDQLTPLKYSEYLSQNLPDAELVIVKGGGHMMALEQPQFVAENIAKWLETLTG
ncbi:MAG: alpha/beta hydrolase [Aggregatilineales bacterium]